MLPATTLPNAYKQFVKQRNRLIVASSQLIVPNSLTYLLNSILQPFRWDYDLFSHITHVVCINFIPEWQYLQFKVVSDRLIFEKLLKVNLFYVQKTAERKPEMKGFFISELGFEPRLHI